MALEYCSLASGSSGNSQYIATNDTCILLDAGLSGKYIKTALENVDRDIDRVEGVLITHEHSDHIKGVGVLHRRYGINIYATELTWDAMKTKIGKIDEDKVILFDPDLPFQVGDINVKPIRISHDAVDPVAFSFESKEAKLSIATDLGIYDEALIDHIKDSSLLVIESNHDVEMLKMGKYPYYLKRRVLSEHGHLSNDLAGEIAARVVQEGRVNNILLAHLSKENNFPELAYETVNEVLKESGIEVGKDINLDMTYRDRVGKIYKVVG